jgi:hypothetical protein
MRHFGLVNNKEPLTGSLLPRNRIVFYPEPAGHASISRQQFHLQVDLYVLRQDEKWDEDQWESEVRYVNFEAGREGFKEAYSLARQLLMKRNINPDQGSFHNVHVQ